MSTLHRALRTYRRALGFRQSQVVVDGLRVVYVEGGRGPALVLLHGLGADKDHFLFLGRRLRRRFRVIIPDLPGFGHSDRPGHIDYRVGAQVERLHAFADALGLGRFALGGNSMGGFIAGAFAVAHPTRVSHLWLLAPAGVESAEPSPLLHQIGAGESQILARSHAEFEVARRFLMARPTYLPRFLLRAIAQAQIQRYSHHLRVMDHLFDSGSLEARFAAAEGAPPTLLMWGEQDRALDISGADVLGRLLPSAQVVRLPEVGHLPQVEAPGRLAREWLRFVDGTPG